MQPCLIKYQNFRTQQLDDNNHNKTQSEIRTKFPKHAKPFQAFKEILLHMTNKAKEAKKNSHAHMIKK